MKRRAGEIPRIDADRAAIGLDLRTERGQAKRVLGLAARLWSAGAVASSAAWLWAGASCTASSQVPSSVPAGGGTLEGSAPITTVLSWRYSLACHRSPVLRPIDILSLPHSYADLILSSVARRIPTYPTKRYIFGGSVYPGVASAHG